MNRKHLILITFLTTTFFALDSFAQAKHALVIGNSNYKHGKLKNAYHDAKLMAKTLDNLGFELVGGKALTNLSKEEMSLEIIRFGDMLRTTKGIGVFYFAGHGVQVNGRNYLIPLNAKMDREEYVKVYGVEVDEILAQMEVAQNKMNLMILDACRNNPFSSSYRSITRGLKMQSAPSGTLILYSTRPSMVAQDGRGRNSPFTTALTSHMKRPGLKIEEVMRETIKDVERRTRKKQTPWQEGFVRDDFYFVKPVKKKVECPSGSKLVGSRCVKKSTECPLGTELVGSKCVIKSVSCPAGTYRQGSQCIARVACPSGSYFKEGTGCVSKSKPKVVEPQKSAEWASPSQDEDSFDSSYDKPDLTTQAPVQPVAVNKPPRKPLFLRPISKEIPKFTYISLGVGVLSHLVNVLGTSSSILDISYFTTIGAYGAATVGLGMGVYKATKLKQPQQRFGMSEKFMPKVKSWQFAFEF